jgi:hypothetical protein
MPRLTPSLIALVTAASALTLAIGAAPATAATTAAATAPTRAAACEVTWGSLAKAHDSTAVSPLVDVRAGRHDCFDRLVLEFRGDTDGYVVQYVDEVTEDGSGHVVPLRGGAKLQVIAVGPAYDDNGQSTYTPANRAELVNVQGWSTFRQLAWAGSFEGQTTIGLGVRAELPFLVSSLDGPGNGSRIVVDVAHTW